jgi:hypothetical protein
MFREEDGSFSPSNLTRRERHQLAMVRRRMDRLYVMEDADWRRNQGGD